MVEVTIVFEKISNFKLLLYVLFLIYENIL